MNDCPECAKLTAARADIARLEREKVMGWSTPFHKLNEQLTAARAAAPALLAAGEDLAELEAVGSKLALVVAEHLADMDLTLSHGQQVAANAALAEWRKLTKEKP